jgi:hypothetical protein
MADDVKIDDNPGPQPKVRVSQTSDVKGVGIDIGTANLVVARFAGSDVETRLMRDAFLDLELTPELEQTLRIRKEQEFIQRGDTVYLLGQSAFNFANIVGKEVKRPLAKGTINPGEKAAAEVLAIMLKDMLGEPKQENEKCFFSVPAPSVDIDNDTIYHAGVFREVLRDLGYDAEPINEAMAIIYSECASDDFSGLAISFGAGMTNVCLSYEGMEGLAFSMAQGGDWIDASVARNIGSTASRIAIMKERNLNLKDYKEGDEKDEDARRALTFYFESHIQYVLRNIAMQFKMKARSFELPDPIPMVVSGGLSLANGFMDWLNDQWDKKHRKDFPIQISEIRLAEDPMTAVARGALTYASA